MSSMNSASGASSSIATVDPMRLEQGMYMSEMTFPSKLFQFLQKVDEYNLSHVASWQPHGRCFRIHDPKAFVVIVEPSWFVYKKYSSFQRQLSMYGFHRITMGPDKNGYYHPQFLRSRQDLVRRIIRVPQKKNDPSRSSTAVSSDPDFYSMTRLPSTNPLQIECVSDNATTLQNQNDSIIRNDHQQTIDTPNASSFNHVTQRHDSGNAQLIDALRSTIQNPPTSESVVPRAPPTSIYPAGNGTPSPLSLLQGLVDHISSQFSSSTATATASSSLQLGNNALTSIPAILSSASVPNTNDLLRHAILSQQLPAVLTYMNSNNWSTPSMLLPPTTIIMSGDRNDHQQQRQQQPLPQLQAPPEQLLRQILNLNLYRGQHQQLVQHQSVESLLGIVLRSLQQQHATLLLPPLRDNSFTSLQQQQTSHSNSNYIHSLNNMNHLPAATIVTTPNTTPRAAANTEAAAAATSAAGIDIGSEAMLMSIILAALNHTSTNGQSREEG